MEYPCYSALGEEYDATLNKAARKFKFSVVIRLGLLSGAYKPVRVLEASKKCKKHGKFRYFGHSSVLGAKRLQSFRF